MQSIRIVLAALAMLLFTATIHAQDAVPEYENYDYIGYLFENTNVLRADLGLPPFTYDERLSAAAFEQSEWMIRAWSYAHVHGTSTPTTRGEGAGYIGDDVEWCCSENTFLSPTRTPEAALNFWIKSRAHYNQLTSTEFDQIGVGFAHGSARTGQVIVFGTSAVPTVGDPVPVVEAAPQTEPAAGGSVEASTETITAETGNTQHTVSAGENLYRIGIRYGTTADAIRSANGLSGNTIFVGQVLTIPVPGAAPVQPAAPSEGVTTLAGNFAPVNPQPAAITDFPCTAIDGTDHTLFQMNRGGVNCRVMVENGYFYVDYAQIGSQEVINMGIVHAVDVFGSGGQPTELCTQGGGNVIFLSASQS
ncbi:MAG: CAP domain-containing protein, partial [Chloroflexota bacterium]